MTGAPAAQPAPALPSDVRVVLLTKPGCHLCDDVRPVVDRVCAQAGATWTEIDITSDPALLEEYWEQIPVTFVDGTQHDFWRIDEGRLRAALAP